MNITWKKQYETGNTEIDSEHKVFVIIISKIGTAIDQQVEWRQLEYLLTELLKYTDFHFCSEENVMRFCNYPDLKNHQEIHHNLRVELRQKIHILQRKEQEKTSELINFLMDWFLNHTSIEDKKIASFINNQ
jgi:hemerythrin